MTAERLLRVAVIGATGAVGSEVLRLLEARRFPLQEMLPIATDGSVGESVEMLGSEIPVITDRNHLHGLDCALLCTPRDQALPWVRAALEAEVPCIDLSGASAVTPEVPLLVADSPPDPVALGQPVVACPGGSALAWARVLQPLHAAVTLRRLVATSFESVSAVGRRGIDALKAETIALFNQQEPPESDAFDHGVAFDCLPRAGARGEQGQTRNEEVLVRELQRVLGVPVPAVVTSVQTPIFAGCGASLVIDTEQSISSAEAIDLLAKTAGVAVWDEAAPGPSTRDAVDEDDVLVGRIRRDPSSDSGLALWLVADPIRLAAVNALRLAEARFARG